MPLQFLAPLFLLAAAAVAVPVILHLIHREKREATPFPSLMFLRRIPHRALRRRRLRDLPLLALRVLALVLLAGAFARPLFEREAGAASDAGGPREVVLLLDRSYSMGRAGAWERARAAARAEIERLGPDDRLSIIAFDAGAAVLNAPGADQARLRALIDELRPGASATRYDPALRLAASRLGASPLARREAVLVSDLQRSGAGEGIEAKLPPGTELRVVPVAPGAEHNLAVSAVTFARERFQGQERVTANARVVNPGPEPVAGATVALELDGRIVARRTVDVEPRSAAMAALPPFTLSGPQRGRVLLGDDALAADNAWHFTLAPDQATRVLLVAPGASAALFLERALEVGGEPGFDVTTRATLPGDLAGFDVVVLNGEPLPEGTAASALEAHVAAGGGLLVALGAAGGATAGFALLPGAPGQLVDRTAAGGGALGYVDLGHAALEVFRSPRSGDLGAARFYRYRPLQLARAPDSAVHVLARFDDGGVAIAERQLGRGRVLALAAPLDRSWSDIAVQPIFVPLVHRLVRHAASFAPARPAYTVDEVVDARAARADDADALLVVAPSGARLRLEAGARALPLAEAGWYTVRAAARPETVIGQIASNVDAREADPAALGVEELAAAATTPGAGAPAPAAAGLSVTDRERRQALWWYLLAAAVALLAAETVLSNRGARAAVRVGRKP